MTESKSAYNITAVYFQSDLWKHSQIHSSNTEQLHVKNASQMDITIIT